MEANRPPEPAQRAPSERAQRAREAAILLPLLGLFLLMPPLVRLFAAPVTLGGVPLIVVYLFGVWLALVLAAALLGRLLGRRGGGPPP